MSKSYWMGVITDSPRSQSPIKSWFAGLIDETDTVTKAEILCDKATDREKKIRIFTTTTKGSRFRLERTLGGKTYSVRRVCLQRAPESPADERARRGRPSSAA